MNNSMAQQKPHHFFFEIQAHLTGSTIINDPSFSAASINLMPAIGQNSDGVNGQMNVVFVVR